VTAAAGAARDGPGPPVTPRQPTALGSWEAENVSVGEVEGALSGLRRHEQRAAVRTSVLTLAAVVHSRAEAEIARSTVHDLGLRHPSRTIVVVMGGDEVEGGSTGIDAAVWVHALMNSAGRAVCFEEVVLTVRGPARYHLDSVVGPFALPDVPLVVWLPASLPAPGDPLLDVANRLVVDSRAVAEGGADALSRASVLCRRLPVNDLSWIRLRPWRTQLAGLFEGGATRPFLDAVDQVEVSGNTGPRMMMGGWLLRRLGLNPARVHMTPAEHVSVRIEATHGGRRGRFSVTRTGPERSIVASVDVEGGPNVEQVLSMEDRWPALALAGALTTIGHDGAYEDALAGARALRAA
jgi:glucose-6-phosphate dehydrogenase assembly protein OpcA